MSLHQSVRENYLPLRFAHLQISSARQSVASDDGLSEFSQINEPLPEHRNTQFNRAQAQSTHTMSTRRSTRGASRQASSRGASPAISTSDIPATPRRAANRRASNALPAVGARQSTAYGSNTIPPPAADAPPVARGFNEVLQAELNPVSLPPRRAASNASRARSTAHSPTPVVSERSFVDESGIFQRAGIESSPISEAEELGNIPELPEPNSDEDDSDTPPTSLEELNDRAERRAMEQMSRNHSYAPVRATNTSWYLDIFAGILQFLREVRDVLWGFFLDFVWYPFLEPTLKLFLTWGLPLILAIAVGYGLLRTGSGVVSAISGNLPNLIPYSWRHPGDMFSPNDVQSITGRLRDLELKVSRLSSHNSDLDPKTLKTIEDMLPVLLVVKKDRHGKSVIPDNLWYALRDKIRQDDSFSHAPVDGGKVSSGEHHIKDLEKEARKLWDRYLKSNQAQLGELSNDEVVRQFPHLLEQNHIIPKTEVLQLIRQSWEDNKSEVRLEMSEMKRKLAHTTQQITKLQHDFKDESRAIADEVLKKFIPRGQLEALAAANLRSNLNYGLTQLNHFSKGTGAVIDPQFTSPQYVFPSMDVWFPKRTMRWLIGNSIPVPNPPDTALMKWEEHGDCWCSPSNANGFGASLAVIMGSSIYPEQIVIEHILPSASLEPGAAPQDIEILAWIPDPELFRKVSDISDKTFNDDTVEPLRADGFVRIATFTYNAKASESIQGFQVQVEMKLYGAHTNKLIVRSKNNWSEGRVDYTCLYRVRVHGEVVATPGLI
ncbi:hypothetical protein ONS95_011064 [Cadophora gregata]|uniref:uncharacterized protein n=1 Tax=Cadophora gregata TaxID=51156 RepID=UPI0026DCBFE5|nr:uncharacterized protein ONS95_011064 [Cadophora gregata]KAK0119625.1 hypothetical protein ONS95_011064 [Cadophora gregata]